MSILVRDVDILQVNGTPMIRSGEIAVENNQITAVGPAGCAPKGFKPQIEINGKGLVATPGLINCHTHAAMSLFRGYADDLPLMEWLNNKIWPIEEKLTEEDIYWGTMLACLEMIRSGTTTFADMYFHMNQVARAVGDAGMRASLCRGLIGVAPNGEEALTWSHGFAREFHGSANGRITVMLGPHAPYTCPPDYLRLVRDAAVELGVGVHIHLAETRSEITQTAEEHGCTPVQLVEQTGLFEIPVLAAHCVHLSDEDISILTRYGVRVVHNPQSNMKLGSGTAPVVKLLAAGITVGLGTDGVASNNDLDMVEEMRSAAFLQKVTHEDPTVLPAEQALSMATVNGARALGLEDGIGTLEVGKKADIVLWDMHKPHLHPMYDVAAHLVYSAHGSDARTVIVDGRVLMRDYEVLVLDEEAVMAESERRARRLVAEVG
ncbi:MAG: amidohydrolase [Eubacteriales bacterium]|jgi:5-methylthioadenosine/S-adenosylhomocysteine deaminase|nr:amidohydrolase [Bacillota bacterium]MBV1726606.1 amidohydrolase [Desulforudis sp.]MDQ7789135.1 amidohydrolase [Clostridia bacterium]MDZ4042855.1 amidohydrolase [Eubacteriales bacterium]MBU4533646.1 amidohydrolase [Bacillota bacterium]